MLSFGKQQGYFLKELVCRLDDRGAPANQGFGGLIPSGLAPIEQIGVPDDILLEGLTTFYLFNLLHAQARAGSLPRDPVSFRKGRKDVLFNPPSQASFFIPKVRNSGIVYPLLCLRNSLLGIAAQHGQPNGINGNFGRRVSRQNLLPHPTGAVLTDPSRRGEKENQARPALVPVKEGLQLRQKIFRTPCLLHNIPLLG